MGEPVTLTAKREAFAQAFVETGNQSEAYRRAYSVKPTTTQQTVWNEASLLMANPEVSVRVAELQAEHANRHSATVDDIARLLREDRDFARECQTPAAAVSATMGLAKLYGHLTDKVDAKVTNGQLPAAVMLDDVA